MAKRFTSTEIWEEDWYLDMPIEYKLFWFYMLSTCDHAGLFKVNLRSFCGLNEVKVDANAALLHFNKGKGRIRIINEGLWLIEDFFSFQYGSTFNVNNPLHRGIESLYTKHNIELTSIRGLKEVNLTLKDKDKVKEIRKGGTGEKHKGVSFTEDQTSVILSNGKKQELGSDQLFQVKRGVLKATEILEGQTF